MSDKDDVTRLSGNQIAKQAIAIRVNPSGLSAKWTDEYDDGLGHPTRKPIRAQEDKNAIGGLRNPR